MTINPPWIARTHFIGHSLATESSAVLAHYEVILPLMAIAPVASRLEHKSDELKRQGLLPAQ